jgi:hypothetical protein
VCGKNATKIGEGGEGAILTTIMASKLQDTEQGGEINDSKDREEKQRAYPLPGKVFESSTRNIILHRCNSFLVETRNKPPR